MGPAEAIGPETSAAPTDDVAAKQPWLEALRPPPDSRRLLAARSAWAILALDSGDDRFAARVAVGLSRPEASRARARLEADGLIAMLPLLAARAGRAWCTTSDPTALARLRSDRRLAFTVDLDDARWPQTYVRAADLPSLVDDYALHEGAELSGHAILLRPVAEPWPLPDGPAGIPELVRALDLLELAAVRGTPEGEQLSRAWALVEARAAAAVPSWYRARRPPRAGAAIRRVRHRALSPTSRALAATRVADADTPAALLFAVGDPVRRADLQAATDWPPSRLQAAADALVVEPPRGQQVLLDGDRLGLVTASVASAAVERLLTRLRRGQLLESLDLPETVWLVLAIIVLEQPITRAEITAGRLADSDRQVQVLQQHRLIREEPRAALPGRGIPLVTTDLVLRRFGVTSIGELQQHILSKTASDESNN